MHLRVKITFCAYYLANKPLFHTLEMQKHADSQNSNCDQEKVHHNFKDTLNFLKFVIIMHFLKVIQFIIHFITYCELKEEQIPK